MKANPLKVCLVTTSQPSGNPRLVKEADALSEAGYDVRVVGAFMNDWAMKFDADLLASRRWRCEIFDWRRDSHPWRFWRSRGRHLVARRLATLPALHPLVAESAVSRIGPDLYAAARAEAADLFIAHNLGALPVAIAAGRAFGVPAGFDAEDFHSGQLSNLEDASGRRFTEFVERRFLPRCAYVTAGSPGIASAYADLCGVRPMCILNVFPLRDRPPTFRDLRPSSLTRLHWFSQTIGPMRGLEDAVRAIGFLAEFKIELHLRGRWQPGYESTLRTLAGDSGVPQERIISHEPASADELVRLSASCDIGLAIEPASSVNNDILLSNKIFTYLLAGNAVLATRTIGQSWLADQLFESVSQCESGNAVSLADALRLWLEDRNRLASARARAWSLGETRFNWDLEKMKFLDVVSGVLQSADASRGRAIRPGTAA